MPGLKFSAARELVIFRSQDCTGQPGEAPHLETTLAPEEMIVAFYIPKAPTRGGLCSSR